MTAPEAPARLRSRLCFFLAAMTFAVFWAVLTHDFVNFDDQLYVIHTALEHPRLDLAALRWAFTTVHYDNWLPLTLLSHVADLQLFGLQPWGHHLTSLLLHAANVLLLFLALDRMTGDSWRSALAAAVFAVHPLQVEAVAWAAQRKTVLSACFSLLALRSYAGYVEAPSRRRYAAVAAAFAAALLAKASVLVLPGLLLLLDLWPLRRAREGWRALALEKLPLFALSAASAAVALSAAELKSLEELPLAWRAANALAALASYLRKAVWPSGLSAYYPHPGAGVGLAWAAGGALLLAAASVAAIRLRRDRPHLLAGWGWFLIGLGPMLGLTQVGPQAMADRYVYLPLIGLAIIAAWEAPSLREGGRRLPVLGVAAAVSALMVAGGMQLRHWRNGVLLFEHALEVDSKNALAHAALAGALVLRGGPPEAVIAHYRRALELAPDAQTHNDLGGALAALGRHAEAIEHLEAAVRLAADPVLAERARANLSKARAEAAKRRAGAPG
ncbi:MAG: glycosyltransferase family 39 protein [Elusimicrobia bacterium]|nr:glycosyltransferase family 39 protein [Elusimicrobiota bacterium]